MVPRLRKDFDVPGSSGFVRVRQNKESCLYSTARNIFEVVPGEFSVHFSLDLEKEMVRQFKPSHQLICKLLIDGTCLVRHLITPVVKRHYEGAFKVVPFYQPKLKETLVQSGVRRYRGRHNGQSRPEGRYRGDLCGQVQLSGSAVTNPSATKMARQERNKMADNKKNQMQVLGVQPGAVVGKRPLCLGKHYKRVGGGYHLLIDANYDLHRPELAPLTGAGEVVVDLTSDVMDLT